MRRADWPSSCWDPNGGFYRRRQLAIAAAFVFYRAVTGEKRSPWLIVLRAVTLAVLLFMFLRPVLNISTVLPQDSYLAVVIDNSESMTIKDDGKTPRSEQLQKQLNETSLIKRLSEKFKVRIYRFDKEAERIRQARKPDFQRQEHANRIGDRTPA